MTIPINQRLDHNDEEFYRILMDTVSKKIRVAVPGIIQSFDAETQTVTAQIAIRESVEDKTTLESKWVSINVLVDVPIVVPRAGGFSITLPVQAGDECLIIFSDVCVDAWWSNGGVQNQAERRRHDLSDGIALLGCYSQPRKVSNYSTTNLQIRSDDGTTMIDMGNGEINLNATTVKANGTVIG